ncbi:RING-H2 finger protein ATL74-like [Rutidosis leptorrhynchoides]|uniref:RING-H2 finger protein ATL74-like n=1 Tax=Rutidosis leptorrhynchoides TaxID=125765 RepID=UPI003A98EC21
MKLDLGVVKKYIIMQRLLLDSNNLAPAENRGAIDGSSQQHSSYNKEANFDTNMMIILVALLCSLVCALGLNSIVRCALRCRRRLVFDGGDGTGGVMVIAGVKEKVLKQIPVVVYGTGVEIPASECPICLGEFMDGEKVRILPQCNHGFHVKCIDIWLASHSSCPTCRRSLVDLPPVVERL